MISIYDAVCRRYEDKYYFSWKLDGNCGQKCYRISVFDSMNDMIWDSDTVWTEKRHNIPCGAELLPGRKYYWVLTVTGRDGETAQTDGRDFYTEIPEWKAKWLSPDRVRKPITDSKNPHEPVTEIAPEERLDPPVYFRQTFVVEEKSEKAFLYMTAHGIYHLWINGELVSDLFAPGYTSYGKRLEYQVADITPFLIKGSNIIAAIVADGWYTGKIGAVGYGQQYGNESALLFQINQISENGKKYSWISDESCKWMEGAYKYADLFVGEYYDAAAEAENWKEADFDDSFWKPVKVEEFGYSNLKLQTMAPVEEEKILNPRIFRSPAGELILDAGENVVGYVSFALDLEPGQVVSMEHSETLTKEGNFLQNIIGHNKDQKDYYRAGESGIQEYCPTLTFHGFRYVKVEGTEDSTPEHYQIHVISTPKKDSGEFRCSDARLNTLHANIVRSQKGNMICIPTDCPQREKTGWTGDAQVYAPTACYEQDMEEFLRHWLVDMRHEQLEDGQIPHIIPYIPSHDYMKPPGIEGVSAAGWSDAAIILPWRLYEAYGDIEILKENFPMIRRYMASVKTLAQEMPQGMENADEKTLARQKYLWNTGFQYGDWLMPSIQMSGRPIFEVVVQTGHIVASLMFAITTRLMAKICELLGEEELKEEYASLNANIKEAFRQEYVNEDGTIKKDYQGVYVLALEAEVLTEEQKPGAIRRLAEKIHENNDLLDTGFLSVPYLLPVLAKNGQRALANTLLFRDECPSWLYEVKMGATTMWEYWNCYAPDGTPDEGSMNHFAFGCVGEYLYRSILGIDFVEPGFGRLRICPDMTCGLTAAEGSYDTIWGKVSVSWSVEKRDGSYNISVILPPDTQAEVILPDGLYQAGCGSWEKSGNCF